MATTTRTQRPRPSGAFELQAWFFMRVSGLALVLLALTHWTLMHFINRLSTENAAWIVGRYQNVAWPLFDATMLLFAMLHGTNGVRYVIEEYIHNRPLNVLAKAVLFTASFVFILFGLITIFMLPHVKNVG
ncbi:MAG TPA: succinate dehydrogenase [Armatimonadota bacterium]|jgi:succinate dehydrogenase / fumarate reductase membrane anchor subunit